MFNITVIRAVDPPAHAILRLHDPETGKIASRWISRRLQSILSDPFGLLRDTTILNPTGHLSTHIFEIAFLSKSSPALAYINSLVPKPKYRSQALRSTIVFPDLAA